MAPDGTAPDLRFEAPGPGFWTREDVHFPRPLTRYFTETHPAAFMRGFRDFSSRYGMLLDTLEYRYVNGVAYTSMLPVAQEQVPERLARAEQVFEKRIWRAQLEEWDGTVKPAAIRTHRELQAVDPDQLSDDDLAAYLVRCRDHHEAMMTQHMRYTAAAMVPTGDFVAHVGEWTGLQASDLLDLLRGSSPVSAGASEELERLIAAIRSDPEAQSLLASDTDAGDALEALRARGGETGEALAAYLDLVGNRLMDGFDICNPRAIEMPDQLIRAIRVGVEGRGVGVDDVEKRVTEVRALVPEEHRAEFDQLLGEARLTYRLRDERGVFSDIWASGIMRRAALAAGRRLAGRGRIHDAEHMIDAGLDEMCALLSGGGPSAEELATRAERRNAFDTRSAPPAFGDPPPPPPDPSTLPPGAARGMRATGIAMGAVFGSSEAPHEGSKLRGLAASKGVYEGPARLVTGPGDFGSIVQGDVLVTRSTTEAFNILLPLLGAIVTDSGGLLSHSAIVAREYGIPGVVGTRDATGQIADGARVRVDGDAGEVTVL